jgi:CRP-like cAMP-binding protein
MADETFLPFDAVGLFKRVDSQATTRDYRNRQVIFAQGDKSDALFYVRHGTVKLTVASKNGKKAVLAILGRGDLFGEGCLVRQSLRMSTATSIHSSTIARVKRAAIVRVLHQQPAFATVFVSYLLFRIGRLEEEYVDQVLNPSEKRLARILLLLVGFGPQFKPDSALLKVSQTTLAEMVGTTRSRVSYFMNRFRKKGLIDYNGSLRVHRALLNFLLHDVPDRNR